MPSPIPSLLAVLSALAPLAAPTAAGEHPPFDEVVDGYTKVVTTTDGSPGLYTLYRKDDGAQMLAELPKGFDDQRLFFHSVVSKGSPLAGVGFLMSQEHYARWEERGDMLALVLPEIGVRNTGSAGEEGPLSHAMLYTDRVLLSLPIVTRSPGGGPVIDLDALVLGHAPTFFGPVGVGAQVPLAEITKAKAFPRNVEVAFELPLGDDPPGFSIFGEQIGGPQNAGRITEFHMSISALPEDTGYEPRPADPRVGFFQTSFNDMAKTASERDPWTRYITRWHVEKADPSLALSPPKRPIVWYMEHTIPIRYRRYIKEGLLEWNKAFAELGIVDAIEVRQQDATSGAYMDIDPEDIRYSFVRWNDNQAAFAIGPSSVDPVTGQIFQADLTINTGIFAAFAGQLKNLMPALATEGFSAETMAWLDEHPQWDPRVRLADPSQRGRLIAAATARRAAGVVPPSGLAALAGGDASVSGVAPQDVSCLAGLYTAVGTDLVRLAVEKDGDDGETAGGTELLDGVPEDYAAAMLRWLTAHESGHCLGLAHNFMASTIRPLDELNSGDYPADAASGGSVMEYPAPNIAVGDDAVQGPWTIDHIGPYDYWAIEYGYTLDDDLEPVLGQVSEPDHVFGSDPDQVGPDPRVRTYDFGADPLQFAEERLALVADLRGKIVTDFVDDGEGWGRARAAYQSLLGQHVQAVSIAAGWVGGSFVHKDFKGDPGERDPIEDIPAETQRRALRIVIDNTFVDEAFGLSPELLHKMSVDRWNDGGDPHTTTDPAYSVHDVVRGVQSAAVTMVMNPTTLRRVFDNEFRVPADEDALTLAEVLETVVAGAFGELESSDGVSGGSLRAPAISSMRRNLQADIVDRLIAMALDDDNGTAAQRTLSSLSRAVLGDLGEVVADRASSADDAYTRSHLRDLERRIAEALEAGYTR